jgi:hypothetical protein
LIDGLEGAELRGRGMQMKDEKVATTLETSCAPVLIWVLFSRPARILRAGAARVRAAPPQEVFFLGYGIDESQVPKERTRVTASI